LGERYLSSGWRGSARRPDTTHSALRTAPAMAVWVWGVAEQRIDGGPGRGRHSGVVQPKRAPPTWSTEEQDWIAAQFDSPRVQGPALDCAHGKQG
jgi:hypothetical protein